MSFRRFLNKFPPSHQPLVRQVIVKGGGWSDFTPQGFPRSVKGKQWFHFWDDLVRDKPLFYYHFMKHKTANNFCPNYRGMSWVLGRYAIRQKVTDYITLRYHEYRVTLSEKKEQKIK